MPLDEDEDEAGGDGEPSSSSTDENKSKQSSSVTRSWVSPVLVVGTEENSGITKLRSRNGSGLIVYLSQDKHTIWFVCKHRIYDLHQEGGK